MLTEPPEIDDGTADRLLAGELAPSSAPAGWERVAALLRAAGDDSEGADPPAELLDAMVAVAESHAPVADEAPVPAVARRRLGLGLGIAAVLVLGGTGAAAAAGSLPGPVQDVVHDIVAVVGFDVPESHEPAPGPPTTSGSQDGDGHGRSDEAPGRPDDPGQPDDPGRSDEAPGRPDDPGSPSDTAPGQDGDPGPPEGSPPETAPGQVGDPGPPEDSPSESAPTATPTTPTTRTTPTTPDPGPPEDSPSETAPGATSPRGGGGG